MIRLPDELAQLFADRGITDWDVALFGDGSGSSRFARDASGKPDRSRPRAIGWGTISLERKSGEVLFWCGAMRCGTNNMAELLAYLDPLTYFESKLQSAREQGDATALWRVPIFTDSQYCWQYGRVQGRGAVKNRLLWGAINTAARSGLVLQWHKIDRDSCQPNRYVDELSRFARRLFEQYNPLEHAKQHPGV